MSFVSPSVDLHLTPDNGMCRCDVSVYIFSNGGTSSYSDST